MLCREKAGDGMIREVDLDEISDGKRYHANDLVKADCNDCINCNECCTGMGNSIILDPYDVALLSSGLELKFEHLMNGKIELNLVDGLILPNLVMDSEREQCLFLNQQGRCSIHAFRPGICRLFPLGRVYENNSFQYFLQTKECRKTNRTKIKVKKWIGLPNFRDYESFVLHWHDFLLEVQSIIREHAEAAYVKNLNLYLLKLFYQTRYEADSDFFSQFDQRLSMAKDYVGSLSE